MNKLKIGPLVTLVAVVALGAGLWVFNSSQKSEPAPPAKPTAASTTTPGPGIPPPSSAPKLPAFPAKAEYVGKIPTADGNITLEISINGDKSVAYACDGNTVEVWLRGSATDGALALANPDGSSRLEAKLVGDDLAGTLFIGERKWDFTAARKAVA